MKKIKLGLIPAHRDLMEEDYAINARNIFLKEIKKDNSIEVICPDPGLTKGGLVRNEEDAGKVINLFEKEKLDAIIICAVTYGDEKSVFTIIENFPDLPVLIYAIKEDEIPANEYFKSAASCGLIPISYGLHRRKVKFTFGGIIKPEEKELHESLQFFIKITNTLNKFKGARIGMIGPRPNDFEICAINEGILLEKYRQRIIYLNLLDLKEDISKIPDENIRVREIIEDLLTGTETDYSKQDLKKLAKLEIVMKNYAKEYNLNAFTVQCWTSMQRNIGITPCITAGRITNQGLPVACEGDVYGAITMLLQQELVFSEEIPLFLDILMQHPEDKELFLAWHCGNASIACKTGNQVAKIMPHCPFGSVFDKKKGAATIEFMIKPGKVTINRVVEHGGNFKLLNVVGEMVKKENDIRGAWSWIKVRDREEMYKTIINEGFTHHVSIIHRDLTELFREVSRYLEFEFVNV